MAYPVYTTVESKRGSLPRSVTSVLVQGLHIWSRRATNSGMRCTSCWRTSGERGKFVWAVRWLASRSAPPATAIIWNRIVDGFFCELRDRLGHRAKWLQPGSQKNHGLKKDSLPADNRPQLLKPGSPEQAFDAVKIGAGLFPAVERQQGSAPVVEHFGVVGL